MKIENEVYNMEIKGDTDDIIVVVFAKSGNAMNMGVHGTGPELLAALSSIVFRMIDTFVNDVKMPEKRAVGLIKHAVKIAEEKWNFDKKVTEVQ